MSESRNIRVNVGLNVNVGNVCDCPEEADRAPANNGMDVKVE